MDDHSLIYQVSPEGIRMMGYYNGVEGFINYVLSNPINYLALLLNLKIQFF
jgi:hypothetical protein